MPPQEIDLRPVTHITTDAIGQPGKRVFYIQGWQDERTITLIVEKIQIQSLAVGLEQFLAELQPAVPRPGRSIRRVTTKTRCTSTPRSTRSSASASWAWATMPKTTWSSWSPASCWPKIRTLTEASVVRFWCTRSQLRAMCQWGMEVASHGRPICPQCGEPMDPEGHFCPKKNGHKH